MLLLGPQQLHAPEESHCGTSYRRTMLSVEVCARHEKLQSTGGQGSRPTALLPPSQPAHPLAKHTAAAGPKSTAVTPATAANAAASAPLQPSAAPLLLAKPLGVLSAGSSPATPAAQDALLTATASDTQPTQQHTNTATEHGTAQPAVQTASPATPPAAAAAVSAATAAVSSTRHLGGSLLLLQLLPLTASLNVALAAGDITKLHAVLTMLQSMPMTGQLLFASQVARPVRRILQQQVQLQMSCMQQQQQQQVQGNSDQLQQQQERLREVVSASQQLLRRWKALLAAEVSARDDCQKARAHQIIRVQRKQAAAKEGSVAAAAAGGGGTGSGLTQTHSTPHAVVPQCSSLPPRAAPISHKRPFDDWVPQQHNSGQQQQHAAPLQQQQHSACPPRPVKQQKRDQSDTPAYLHQQRMPQPVYSKSTVASAAAAAPAASPAHGGCRQGVTRVPVASAGAAAAAAAAAGGGKGSSFNAAVKGGPGAAVGSPLSSDIGSSPHCSSGFSLGGSPVHLGSSTDDLAVLGFDWEHSHLPGHHLPPGLVPMDDVLGATAAAAADAALAGVMSAGIGGDGAGGWPGGGGPVGEGAWGDGEEDGGLLVEGGGVLQGQGLEAAAFVL